MRARNVNVESDVCNRVVPDAIVDTDDRRAAGVRDRKRERRLRRIVFPILSETHKAPCFPESKRFNEDFKAWHGFFDNQAISKNPVIQTPASATGFVLSTILSS